MTETLLYAVIGMAAALLILAVITIILLTKTVKKPNAEIKADDSAVISKIEIYNRSVTEAISIYNDSVAKSLAVFRENQQTSQIALEAKFMELLNSMEIKLHNIREQLGNSLNEVRTENNKQFSELRNENNKQLTEMRSTVDEKLTATLNSRITESFNVISERLEAVSKGLGEMKNLSTGVESLNKVLTNVKTRGQWGEVSLDTLLSQMLTPSQYGKQVTVGRSKERVDFAVILPGSNGTDKVILPIDSKFPLEDYDRLVDASERADKALVEQSAKALNARFKEFAKDISAKYIKPPETTDFAIMYLPVEGLFAEAVRQPGLADELQNRYRIILCGPTTLSALLNSLQMGFKTLAVQERSSEVWKLLSAFKKDFENFAGLLQKTEKKMDEVTSTIRDASKRTAIIGKKLRNVEAPDDGLSLEEAARDTLLLEELKENIAAEKD